MRRLRYILTLLFILICRGLSAQEFDLYDFRYYKRFESVEELLAPEVKDSVLLSKFNLDKHFSTRILDYNFSSMVRFQRRGVSSYRHKTTINGVEIPFLGSASIRALQLKKLHSEDIGKTHLHIDTLHESRS